MNGLRTRPEPPGWIETQAKIVACHYRFARLNTLTLGIQTGERFRVVFEYYAHGRLHTGEFQSKIAIPQSENIPIRYNPLRPEENTYSAASGALSGSRTIAFGVAGSIVISLVWLAILRGCS